MLIVYKCSYIPTAYGEAHILQMYPDPKGDFTVATFSVWWR